MKFIRKIAQSRFALPICGALSLMAFVYIAFAIREMMADQPLSQRLLLLPPTQTEHGFYIPTEEQIENQSEMVPDDLEIETFTGKEEIELPASPMPEDSPSKSETEQMPEIQTQPPLSTQIPQQTTPSQTQKPAQTVTTKPPQTTQKPENQPQNQPQTTPITAWNVTLKQAKSMVKSDSAYDYEDLYWLSRIISAEAKGESFTGQIGVGTVVLNRVRSKEFPNTVKGVVFDKKYGTQFTPVANGSIYDKPTESAIIAAKMCLDGYTLSNSVLYFLNPRIATSSWIQNNRKYAFRVGNHDFYY